MNYTLNQLLIFLKIAKLESITKAAEELHLTQPAVSIQLKNFQMQFDIPLTETLGRKIHITDFGNEIAEAAKNILEQVEQINFKTLAHKGQLTGNLKISIVSTGKYIMPFFLSEFVKKHPGIKLIMDVTNKERVIESLEKNEVDFSLVSVLPPSVQVETLDLFKNKLYLVGKNELKTKVKSPEAIFENLPLIYREKGSGTRHAMEAFMKHNNIVGLKKMELTSNEAVKQALLADMGYSIMPLIGIKNELQNGELKIIPVPGLPIETNWQIIWPKGKNHGIVAKTYLEYLTENKSEICTDLFKWYENY